MSRGVGVGAKLVHACYRHAQKNGKKILWLVTALEDPENPGQPNPAIKFYERKCDMENEGQFAIMLRDITTDLAGSQTSS